MRKEMGDEVEGRSASACVGASLPGRAGPARGGGAEEAGLGVSNFRQI